MLLTSQIGLLRRITHNITRQPQGRGLSNIDASPGTDQAAHYGLRHRPNSVVAVVLVAVLGSGSVGHAQAQSTPRGTVNQAANICQVPASYLVETGVSDLVKLKVKDLVLAYLNPADDFTEKKKKKIQKAVAMIVVGMTAAAICPPIIVPDGFREWSGARKREYALSSIFVFDALTLVAIDLPQEQIQKLKDCFGQRFIERQNFKQILAEKGIESEEIRDKIADAAALNNAWDPLGITVLRIVVDELADPDSCSSTVELAINEHGLSVRGS